ncbi:hypothetical protein N9Z27_01165 [Alphaproteobacteria bacterium]|nr:hypothetical protein [Alphaproteobacteria bacterium]
MIKRPFVFWMAVLILITAFVYGVGRIVLLTTAERTTGTIVQVVSENGRCGGARWPFRHTCTKYKAAVIFSDINNKSHTIHLNIGHGDGYNIPLSEARLQINDGIKIVYSPYYPEKAFEDSIIEIWIAPVCLFLGGLIVLFYSFSTWKDDWNEWH